MCVNKQLLFSQEKFKSLKCTSCKTGTLHEIDGRKKCCICSKEVEIDEKVKSDLKKAEILFNCASDAAERGNDDVAVERLKECLRLRKEHLYKYHEDIANTLDFIGKIYAMSGETEKNYFI